MLGAPSYVTLPTGDQLRITAEYRYLGVIQTPRDTGRRDTEISAQRAQAAWAHARSMLASGSVPWALKQAWVAGRVLPAAYATIATNIAISARATAPLRGFFERAMRQLAGSWCYGHVLTTPLLSSLGGLSAPDHAALIARVRLVVQIATRSPPPVRDLFEAAWSRATPWTELLRDACCQVAEWLPPHLSMPCFTLRHIQERSTMLLKACRFLSRWGTPHRAFCDLWSDLDGPRTSKIIGDPGEFRCGLCRAVLPSRQALAAHVHRKHSVVSCVTRYTLGTACLWCHTQFFSTDRLKYHLRTARRCMHGLRVTVGAVYEYGSVSKRQGQRGHRGLPPTRLIGPTNATPAERHAAAAGRVCTEDELTGELVAAVGVRTPWEWPNPLLPDRVGDDAPVPEGCDNARGDQPPAQVLQPLPQSPGEALVPSHDVGNAWRWWTIGEASQFSKTDLRCPSPLWKGFRTGVHVWQIPSAWHKHWAMWRLASRQRPWAFASRKGLASLRAAYVAEPCGDGPSTTLTDLLAATVTLRQVCAAVERSGVLWMLGFPSSVGLFTLRELMPSASFHFQTISSFKVFAAARPTLPKDVWLERLQALLSTRPQFLSPRPLLLRSSLVYHSRSLNAGALL